MLEYVLRNVIYVTKFYLITDHARIGSVFANRIVQDWAEVIELTKSDPSRYTVYFTCCQNCLAKIDALTTAMTFTQYQVMNSMPSENDERKVNWLIKVICDLISDYMYAVMTSDELTDYHNSGYNNDFKLKHVTEKFVNHAKSDSDHTPMSFIIGDA